MRSERVCRRSCLFLTFLPLIQEADQVQRQWLEAHSQTLSAKLQVIEKQLLAMTYTSDSMPALQKIDDQLTRAQRQLDARDQQVLSLPCLTAILSCSVQKLTCDACHC